MTLDPIESAALSFTLQVERLYAALIAAANADPGLQAEPGLGGKLLYAGELDGDGRALLVAGNISGAASLGATSDLAAQKQAVRDGVADFLVTSLDEALRVLKNEIRKRETVAVCVGVAPEAVEREMLERGVLPDLLRPIFPGAAPSSNSFGEGARRIELTALEERQTLLTWRVAAAPAQWLPKLDAMALDCLKADGSQAACPARRWLRLAPRYLGRLAQSFRLMVCDHDFSADFIEQVRDRIEHGEIGVAVEIQVSGQGMCDHHRFSPHGNLESAN